MSAEVAVDAPPGLQQMGWRSPLSPPLSSISPPKSPGDMKEELIREVTDAVREHIELKTSSAVDVLWQRGQKALHQMQQNQLNQTATLRAQLEAHADMQKKLEHDNAMLRQALEALVTRLSGVLSQPQTAQGPHFSPPPQPEHPSMMASTFAAAAAAAVSKASKPVAVPTSETAQTTTSTSSEKVASIPARTAAKTSEAKRVSFDCKPDNIEPEAETFHTPAGSPQRTVPQVSEGVPPSTSTAATAQLPSVPSMPGFPAPTTATPAPDQTSSAPTFQVILRRADNVPLGLDVRGDANETCLIVESVRAGGAVEAWNKQCTDTKRMIKTGDHIVKINDAEDSDSMREQCISKFLLRIVVARGQLPPGGNLRADADEFVPRVC